MLNQNSFNDILSTIDDMSKEQTVKLLLSMRSLAVGDVSPIDEAVSCMNALKDEELITSLRVIKNQYNESDWNIIMSVV